MSLNCEPSELTPLRRSNHSRPQQQIATVTTATTTTASASNHLQSIDFSEYMSINNNNHPVGSDSSRGDTSEPNSQQAFNPKSFMMSDTRRVMTRITIDFVILLSGESFFFISYLSFISFLGGKTEYKKEERTLTFLALYQCQINFISHIDRPVTNKDTSTDKINFKSK